MNLRVRSVTGCSLSAIFAGGRVDYSAYDSIETDIEGMVVSGGRCRLKICGKFEVSSISNLALNQDEVSEHTQFS